MKTIRINFVDFWDNFDKNNNFIINRLRKKYNVILDENPEYCFCSFFGAAKEALDKSVVLIFYGAENYKATINKYDYVIDSFYSNNKRHLRFPLWALSYERFYQEKQLSGNEFDRDFCSYVYSNPNNLTKRKELFNTISQYKEVVSPGRCENNTDIKIGAGQIAKIEFLNNYKFNIACENSYGDGYTSEKILDAFSAKTIPIYKGNRFIIKDFNPRAFINVDWFKNDEELIKRIKEIDTNKDLYYSMLKQDFLTDEGKQYIKENYLADFLFHIVDQSHSTAKR